MSEGGVEAALAAGEAKVRAEQAEEEAEEATTTAESAQVQAEMAVSQAIAAADGAAVAIGEAYNAQVGVEDLKAYVDARFAELAPAKEEKVKPEHSPDRKQDSEEKPQAEAKTEAPKEEAGYGSAAWFRGR